MRQRASMQVRQGAAGWVTLTVEGEMAFHDGVPTLRDLQNAVGGYVEAVRFSLAGSEATMFVDEEGKLVAEPRRNYKADVVCSAVARYGDWIAGNVALTGGVGPDGETLGLTDPQVAELRRIDRDVCVLLIDDVQSGVVTADDHLRLSPLRLAGHRRRGASTALRRDRDRRPRRPGWPRLALRPDQPR
jgi:hypothetical protein